jgi:putative SOS response-associated peptidase YedK
MCGRFTLTAELIILVEHFGTPMPSLEWKPRYNIAPTQSCLTVKIENDAKIMTPMVWGLIPHWSKDKKSAYSMINARVETVKDKPTFRQLFKTQRCLIPADGFFEWKSTQEGKIPFRIVLKTGSIFSFAGLWDQWKDEKGTVMESFTILTTQANPLVQHLHDRMPVILKKEDEDRWLDLHLQDQDFLNILVQPYAEKNMKLYEVSPLVNSWKNESPDCIRPK